MADAARPAPAAATAAPRRRRWLAWIASGLLALAGIGLIAHGAARQLAGALGRSASSADHTTEAQTPAVSGAGTLASRAAPADPSTPGPAPKAGAAATAMDARTNEAAATKSSPTSSAAAGLPGAAPAGVGDPEAGVSAGPARSAMRGTPPAAAPTRAPPHPSTAPHRRLQREDDFWADDEGAIGGRGEPPPFIGDGAGRAWRPHGRHDFPFSEGERRPRDPQSDRPLWPRRQGDDPRAGYPRSANPY